MRPSLTRLLPAAILLCALGCAPLPRHGAPQPTRGPVPLRGSGDDHVNLWPVFYASDSTFGAAWPLIEVNGDKRTGRVVPVFWGKDYFVAFPLVWAMKDWSGVFPLFWWDDGFTVFPVLWHWDDGTVTLFPVFWREGDGRYLHCFPLWLHWEEGGGHDTHVLWPVFRLVSERDEKGFRVWPFVGHYAGKDRGGGSWRYTYALWPLLQQYRECDERTRVAAPFYYEHGTKDKGWWLLLPLAFRWKRAEHSLTVTPLGSGGQRGEDSLTLTPLWSGGQRGDTRWSALTPLYYHSANRKDGTERLITPLFARARSPECTQWMVVPLASSLAWGKGEKNLWLFGPLVHARWGGDRLQHHVLPLYCYDREKKLILTPLLSRQSQEKSRFLNVGGVLAHSSRDGEGRKSLSFLWPLINVSWGGKKDGEAVRLLPLFAWGRRKRVQEWRDDERWIKTEHRNKWLWIAPWTFLKWSTTIPVDEPGNAATGSKEHESSAFPLWYYYRYWRGAARPSPAPGLPGMPEPGNAREVDFRLLGWLYEHHRRATGVADAEARVKSRILWRLVRYERQGDDASLDVFPFITWDRKADGARRVSFLWRLYRNERTAAGGRNLDVLFLPVWRGK